MSKPLISVIVPAFNIAPYIGRCLDSLLAQTYKDIEMIVINDGSVDQTGDVINKYASINQRIKAIHKENTGVSDTRNVGIEAANGDYIGFVDGDDIVDQDMYEFLYNNLVRYDADISHCGYRIVRPGKADIPKHGTGKVLVQTREQGIKDLLVAKIVEPGICNKLYKRVLFEGVRLDSDIKINEDLLLNIRLFSKSKRAIFVDVPKYNYILRKRSASQSSVNRLDDPVEVLDRICKLFENDIDIYPYAKTRKINVDINCYKHLIMSRRQEEKEYMNTVRQRLKNSIITIDRSAALPKKTKWMAWMIAYTPFMFRAAYIVYDKLAPGRDHYEV